MLHEKEVLLYPGTRHVHHDRPVYLPYMHAIPWTDSQQPTTSPCSATSTAPWMPNACLAGTVTYILSASVILEAPVPPCRPAQVLFVSISEIWSESSGRPNPSPAVESGPLASTAVGTAPDCPILRWRFATGSDPSTASQVNLIRSPSGQDNPESIHGCPIPSHPIHPQ